MECIVRDVDAIHVLVRDQNPFLIDIDIEFATHGEARGGGGRAD